SERYTNKRSIAGHRAGDESCAKKDARQPVVILGGYRVEFVVMAAGARQAESQERAANDINLIVDVVGDHQILVHGARDEVCNRQHARGNQAVFVDSTGTSWRQQIAGDLVPYKIRIREIPIESVDNPVSIAPNLTKVALGR